MCASVYHLDINDWWGSSRVARDSTVYKVGLPLCSVAITALSEVEVLSQVLGAEP